MNLQEVQLGELPLQTQALSGMSVCSKLRFLNGYVAIRLLRVETYVL
jgi:hypothetical protein